MTKGSSFQASLLNLVRRVGFEPATPWFVARYSIQLSYRRVRSYYAHFQSKMQILLKTVFLVVLIGHCSAIFKAKAKQRFLINP